MKKKRRKIVSEGKAISKEAVKKPLGVLEMLNQMQSADPTFMEQVNTNVDRFEVAVSMISVTLGKEKAEVENAIADWVSELERDVKLEKRIEYIEEHLDTARENINNVIVTEGKIQKFKRTELFEAISSLIVLYVNSDPEKEKTVPSEIYIPCPTFAVKVQLTKGKPELSTVLFYDGETWLASLEHTESKAKPWRARILLGGGNEVTERYYTSKISGVEKIISELMLTYFFRDVHINFVEDVKGKTSNAKKEKNKNNGEQPQKDSSKEGKEKDTAKTGGKS